jgi:DNA mismatch repair protein MutL
MSIKILASEVIDRIAAGEVVERPAAVVKELLENSLDAGATLITIETRGGGIGLIQVVDNGSGIPADELELAFQRHATSKISSAADLESISSLGFRGEALPSIAAVAEVEITTCTADSEGGSYLIMQEGTVVGRGVRGRSRGTTVVVRNLFRNVPARLKFLKSTDTENSHVAQVVSQYALAYPEIKFSLTIDGRHILSTTGSGKLNDAVLAVYGLDTARGMLEIKSEGRWGELKTGSITVGGLVGSPKISRTSHDYLSFFVNRRWINSRLLLRAVEDAYHGMLTVGRHPMVVLDVELSPKEVDVNIHPSKSEVKFENERAIFGAVQKAVKSTLINLTPVPLIEQPIATYTPIPYSINTGSTILPPEVQRIPHHEEPDAVLPLTSSQEPTPLFALPALRLLGQMAVTYIIAEGPDGLYIIDQHAAHERILFEKIQRQRSQSEVVTQGFLEPVVFEASPRQNSLLKLHQTGDEVSLMENLAGFGFDLEPFGNNTFLLRAAPAGLDAKGCLAAIRELLDLPSEGKGNNWLERIAESIACHGAVKAGQVLSDSEMRELVRELEQTTTPHTCPHGRPTIIHLKLNQLEKDFKRVQ